MRKLFIVQLLIVFAVAARPDKCRALVLQAGGDRGAYEAGVIGAFVDALPPEERSWQVLTGISIGAMSSYVFGHFPPEEDEAAAELLYYFWKDIAPQKLFVPWEKPLETWQHSGMFNNSVIVYYLERFSKPHKIQRRVTVGAADANTGQYVRFNSSIPYHEFFVATRGSATVPGYFPAVDLHNHTLLDGGIIKVIDVDAAIKQCEELGYEEKDI